MKHLKKLALVLAVVMLFSLLTACGKTSAHAESTPTDSGETTYKPVVWKVSHNAADGQATAAGFVQFADLIKERTDGRITIELYGNNVLGSDTETREMLMEGTIDILAIGAGYMGVYNGACNLINMPYNFANREELLHMYDSEWGQKYIAEPFLSEYNVRLIDYWPNSDRQFISTKPVRSAEDLDGVKLRIPSGYNTHESVWSDLGAMTVTMAIGDAVTGMQQNVIDAVEMPIDYLFNYGFHEIAKYLSLTRHSIYAQCVFIREDSLNAVSPEDQKIVLDTIKECGLYATDVLDASEAEVIKKMEDAGVEIIDFTAEQRQVFLDVAKATFEEYMDDWGRECYDAFTAELEAFRAG